MAPYILQMYKQYVDDTFLIWQHGEEKLTDFVTFLNSFHHSIKFTTELEKEGRHPFLDILLIRKSNGTLVQTIYRKPTHTNLYISSLSHHHPAPKWAALSILVYTAINVANKEHLDEELKTLR